MSVKKKEVAWLGITIEHNGYYLTQCGAMFIDENAGKLRDYFHRRREGLLFVQNGPPVPSALEWRAPEIKGVKG